MRAQLPSALVPGAVERVDSLPLTATGKVDRLALTSLAATAGRSSFEEAERPRTDTEQAIAQVWGSVVGVPEPTLGDDFFALGGHSLLATRLAARLSATVGREVPILVVHENPVLGDLCRALTGPASGEPEGEPVDGGTLPRVPPCPVTTVTDSRLDTRILDGSLRPLDAAAITYVPGHWRRERLVSPTTWREEFIDSQGFLASVLDTPVGRIGVIVAPLSADQLYDQPGVTADVTVSAVERARSLGARAVSLTGLLPSATAYGATVSAKTLVPVTTGHEVTAAASRSP